MQPDLLPRIRSFSFIALGILILDQFSKWVVAFWIMNPPQIYEITSFFNLVLAWNRGISFSLLEASDTLQVFLLIGLALLIVGFLFTWLIKSTGSFMLWGISLIIGGAVGNIIDRIRFGAVIDFLDFHVYQWHWPAFNVADSAICIGVGLILLDNLVGKDREE